MVRCFSHCFWVFLGRKPPCCDVRFVKVGRGVRYKFLVLCLRFLVLVDLVLCMLVAIG